MADELPTPRIPVTKLDAATRQLNAAIALFFDGGDEVAVHTLAAAAEGLLSDLAKARGLIRMIDFIKPERQKEFLRAVRAAQNFFKHADNDPDQVFAFAPEQTHSTLFEGIYYCWLMKVPLSPEQNTFLMWFAQENPDVIMWDAMPPEFRQLRELFRDYFDPLDALNLRPFRQILEKLRKQRCGQQPGA